MAKPKASEAKLYKVLVDGCSVHGGQLEWSLPEGDKPGDWQEVEGDLVRCSNGLHLTTDPSQRWRNDAECYLVEVRGAEMIGDPRHDEEIVVRSARLVRRLTWEELAAFGITPEGIDRDSKPQLARAKANLPPVPPPPKRGPSAAMKLVSTVWDNRCGSTEHSWRRVNSAMNAALMLAIEGGLSFALGDFAEISRTMRGSFWMGEPEHFFGAAVEQGHRQACLSFEAWRGRGPFLWERKRLFVGAHFYFAGCAVAVTSFAGDGSSLTACSYREKEHRHDYRTRIERRFTVTPAQLHQAELDRRVELAVLEEAKVAQKKLHECQVFVPVEVVVAWSPEERASAVEWAVTARYDARKERVKPPPAPPHVAAAKVVDDRSEAQHKLYEVLRERDYAQGKIRDLANDLVDLDGQVDKLRLVAGEDTSSA